MTNEEIASTFNESTPLALSFEERLQQLIDETSALAKSLEEEIPTSRGPGSSWAAQNWTR